MTEADYRAQLRHLKSALRLERQAVDLDHQAKRRAIDDQYQTMRAELDARRQSTLYQNSGQDAINGLIRVLKYDEHDRELESRHVTRAELISWAIRFKLPIPLIEKYCRGYAFTVEAPIDPS